MSVNRHQNDNPNSASAPPTYDPVIVAESSITKNDLRDILRASKRTGDFVFQISCFFSSYERFLGHTNGNLLASNGDALPSNSFGLHSKFASKLSTTNWKLYDKNKINRVHKIE
mmetsp:Transcript_20161/g.24856  ORF Transcript_20161/g.24856 Transcript_20161/m.24856 type:complete len:114 (-) Transcript_20161:986-1327(-)